MTSVTGANVRLATPVRALATRALADSGGRAAFPGRIRGPAVAVATAANWGSAFLVSQFFLSLVGAIGDASTFWLFALFCVLAWVCIYFRVPETKGQSLEQIQQLWKQPA